MAVDPLPKLILRAPSDRPGNTNPNRLTKVGFQYVIAHRKETGFYWNKTRDGNQIPGNMYPIESQVISHVPSVKKAKKLRLPGSNTIARRQENSPAEVTDLLHVNVWVVRVKPLLFFWSSLRPYVERRS